MLTLLVLLFSRRRRVGRFRRRRRREEEEEEEEEEEGNNNEELELENSWKFDVNKKAARQRFRTTIIQTIQTTERRRRKNECW